MKRVRPIHFVIIIAGNTLIVELLRISLLKEAFESIGYLGNLLLLPSLLIYSIFFCWYIGGRLAWICVISVWVGYLLNMTAFIVNGGRFPTIGTDAAFLQAAGVASYYLPENASKLAWLGDWRVLSGFSIGDIFLIGFPVSALSLLRNGYKMEA